MIRLRSRITRFTLGAAVAAFFVEALAWITRTDLTHWVKMREQVSDAWGGGL